MKKKQIKHPSEFAYEPVQQENKPLWMTQMEGPERPCCTGRTLMLSLLTIAGLLLFIYLLLNYKYGDDSNTQRGRETETELGH